jgi:hypothetical protein
MKKRHQGDRTKQKEKRKYKPWIDRNNPDAVEGAGAQIIDQNQNKSGGNGRYECAV